MADNSTLNSGSGGNTIRTLEDGSSIHWPAGVCAFATTVGTPDVLSIVTPTAGLPVRLADGSGYISALPVTDNGGSLTVDGTVAATQSGTWTVTGAGGTFPVTDSGGSLTVDAPVATPVFVRLSDGSSAITTLPVSVATVPSHDVTNAGTFAVQAAQSGTWTVQPGNTANTTAWLVTGTGGTFPATDAGGSLTVDAPVGTPVFVRLSDGASAISTLPVSLASVPSHAVTNAGTFAVQVDGSALTALQLIDNLVLAEDAAHGSGDAGVQALAVRNDSDTSLAGTTGDYTPLQVDANGYLKVNIKAGAGSGGTASTDDAAFTAASGSGTPMMGFVTADAVDAGDVGVVGMLANRQLKVTLYDSGGVELAVGGGTQYTEDAAAAANPVGNSLNLIRDDARGGSLTTTDGDNVAARGTNAGELYVKHVDSIPVTDNGGSLTVDGTVAATQSGTWTVQPGNTANTTAWLVTGTGGTFPVTDSGGSLTVDNGGTFAVQESGAALTALQLIDNIVLAEDAASASGDPGVQLLAVRKATPANVSGTDGDYEPLQVSAGRLWASATIDAALPAGTNNIGDVDVLTLPNVTLAAGTNTNEVVGDAAHDAAAAGNPLLMGAYASAAAPTDVTADGDAVRVWALRSGAQVTQPTFSGVLAVAGNGASGTGVQRVTIANDSTGILAGVTTVTTVTTCSTVSTLTGGGVAHDGADSGNPHKIGAKATTSVAGVTLVANADRTDLYAGSDGVLIVRPECSLEDVVQERTTNTDGASTAFAAGLAAPGAGIRLWIKSVTIANSSASFCTVDLRDGAAGSVLWTFPVPATGGVTHKFDPPLKLTANTALAFDASAATTTLTISANGFKSKV